MFSLPKQGTTAPTGNSATNPPSNQAPGPPPSFNPQSQDQTRYSNYNQYPPAVSGAGAPINAQQQQPQYHPYRQEQASREMAQEEYARRFREEDRRDPNQRWVAQVKWEGEEQRGKDQRKPGYNDMYPQQQQQQAQSSPSSGQRVVQPYPSYQVDGMGFPIVSSVDPFQNFMYSNPLPGGFDPNMMKSMILPNSNRGETAPPAAGGPATSTAASNEPRKKGNELSNVLPVVMTGPRPYSPSTSQAPKTTPTSSGNQGSLGPLTSTQKIRVPSHLLLTTEQRNGMEDISVVKRVFDIEDQTASRNFLSQHSLLPEQLIKPLNKWKTRNTRKRKHATTHLYQCCCGSDVKQFHGTKGTRRSKQKFPFVGCLAFVEVARRTEDGSLIWARGLLDHTPECTKAQPFVSQ